MITQNQTFTTSYTFPFNGEHDAVYQLASCKPNAVYQLIDDLVFEDLASELFDDPVKKVQLSRDLSKGFVKVFDDHKSEYTFNLTTTGEILEDSELVRFNLTMTFTGRVHCGCCGSRSVRKVSA